MKISVVTATWNSAETLRGTLDSVIGQTHRDVEHIVVDGNSTDHTRDLLAEYGPRYEASGKVLRWISEPDRGVYDAMNKGIAMATGEVIGLLNSDDFYTSANVLRRVADEVRDVDAVYADIHYVDPSDLSRCVRYYSSRDFSRQKMRLGFMPAHPSFYCRRSIYQNYGCFDLDFKVAADFEQLFRLIYIHDIAIRYIDADFVTMRIGGASTSGLSSHKQILRDHQLAYAKNIPDKPFAAKPLRCLNGMVNMTLDVSRYLPKLIGLLRDKILRPHPVAESTLTT